jgi:hypothetical protein
VAGLEKKSGSKLPLFQAELSTRVSIHKDREKSRRIFWSVLLAEGDWDARELKRELDAGEDAAGAGFLPGEIDAMDDG